MTFFLNYPCSFFPMFLNTINMLLLYELPEILNLSLTRLSKRWWKDEVHFCWEFLLCPYLPGSLTNAKDSSAKYLNTNPCGIIEEEGRNYSTEDIIKSMPGRKCYLKCVSKNAYGSSRWRGREITVSMEHLGDSELSLRALDLLWGVSMGRDEKWNLKITPSVVRIWSLWFSANSLGIMQILLNISRYTSILLSIKFCFFLPFWRIDLFIRAFCKFF